MQSQVPGVTMVITVPKTTFATDQGPVLAHPMAVQEALHVPQATARTVAAVWLITPSQVPGATMETMAPKTTCVTALGPVLEHPTVVREAPHAPQATAKTAAAA